MKQYEPRCSLIARTNGGRSSDSRSVGSVRLLIFLLRTDSSVAPLISSPNSLREVYITGGLAPMVSSPDEVYMRLFRTLHELHH